jgi:hypothetical protein
MRGLLNPPALVMLMVQVIIASVSVLYKVAVNDGTSISVLTAYRLIFAAAITIPLAFIFERLINSYYSMHSYRIELLFVD